MKNKLELTWIGKGKEEKIEPRILLFDSEKSYGDKDTENMLIHGNNLLALKALESKFLNKINSELSELYNIVLTLNSMTKENEIYKTHKLVIK